METPVADKSAGRSRTFLRIPARMAAAVFIEGKYHKKVLISDLSSAGLSFVAEEEGGLPPVFQLRFRLKPFSGMIDVMVESKNRLHVPNGIRIGCLFLQISKKDEGRINNYLGRILDLSLADNVLFAASFLCVIDASWRIMAYLVNSYYIGTDFGRDAGMRMPPLLHNAALLYYGLSSFAAAAVTGDIIKVDGRKRFILGLAVISTSFLYLVWKNISYGQDRLWDAKYLFAKNIFWWQMFLVLYLACSILICLALFRKVRFIFKAIHAHSNWEGHRLIHEADNAGS